MDEVKELMRWVDGLALVVMGTILGMMLGRPKDD